MGRDSSLQPDGRVCSAVPESLCAGLLLWPLSPSACLLLCVHVSLCLSLAWPSFLSVSPSVSVCPCLSLCLWLSLSGTLPPSVCVSLFFTVCGSVSLEPPSLWVCVGSPPSLGPCLSLYHCLFLTLPLFPALPIRSLSLLPHICISSISVSSPSLSLLPPLLSFGERRDTFSQDHALKGFCS